MIEAVDQRNGIRNLVHERYADELAAIEIEPLPAMADGARQKRVNVGFTIALLQRPAPVSAHEPLIAVVKIDNFAAGEQGVKLGADRGVLPQDAPLAQARLKFADQHAEAPAGGARRAGRAENLPSETSIPAGQQLRILRRG